MGHRRASINVDKENEFIITRIDIEGNKYSNICLEWNQILGNLRKSNIHVVVTRIAKFTHLSALPQSPKS